MGALSKGCGTCKRRKVKCDERRPQCARCWKAGIGCSGFATRLRFVDETPRIQRSMQMAHAKSYESTPQTLSPLLAVDTGQSRRFHCNITPASPTNTLPLTAFRDDIFISYLLFKLFETSDRYLTIDGGATRCGTAPDWTSVLVKKSKIAYQKSWVALAALVFGQAHSHRDSTSGAHELYGQALSAFRQGLSRSDDRFAKDRLACLTALYMYEMLAYRMGKGWMFHANGLGWFMERRGPHQQKSFAGKSIFLEHRILLISTSIISGQGTFLCNSTWKSIPWEDDPASKSAIDYLVDIGADIAGYVAQIKGHNTKNRGHELELSRLTRQVAASLQELNSWWQQWEANHTWSATELALHQGIREPIFSTLLYYDTPWTAFTTCTYNAMRILLLQLWNTLQLTFYADLEIHRGVVLDVPNSTALLGIASDTRGLALEILRSLRYSYRMSRRIIFSCSFFFIRDIAYGCFPEGSKEATWVARHGWADSLGTECIEDMNLLKMIPPLGRIKI